MDRSRENGGEAAASAVRSVSDAAASVAERVGDSIEQSKAALADVQEMLSERTRECMETTDNYVRANPWVAVGIAAGVGLIVGMLARRR